jgi:uroporphyrinogen decarboxylase
MKFSAFTTFLLISSVNGFAPSVTKSSSSNLFSAATENEATSQSGATTKDPLLIRAARGEETERTPVWMMRQAGRHIKEYRDLVKKYPTFRERSEIPEVAVEVSLQPWRNYKTDGCILFSDILTPLPGMGIEFDIDEKVGPVVTPIRDWDAVQKVSSNHMELFALCCLPFLCLYENTNRLHHGFLFHWNVTDAPY